MTNLITPCIMVLAYVCAYTHYDNICEWVWRMCFYMQSKLVHDPFLFLENPEPVRLSDAHFNGIYGKKKVVWVIIIIQVIIIIIHRRGFGAVECDISPLCLHRGIPAAHRRDRIPLETSFAGDVDLLKYQNPFRPEPHRVRDTCFTFGDYAKVLYFVLFS